MSRERWRTAEGKDLITPELLTVIISYIESNCPVSASPDDRAIAGLSMGGHQTLYQFKRPIALMKSVTLHQIALV